MTRHGMTKDGMVVLTMGDAAPVAKGDSAVMDADLVIANATVVDPDGLRHGVDIVIRDGMIQRIEPAGSETRTVGARVESGGRVVVPAFTNIHHHLYSGLLRGAPPGAATSNQRERLERVIWPFERRLTPDDVRLATQLGLLEAIAAGTTTVVDHHASSGCIPGILDVIAGEVVASGTRALLCYEITDRDGPAVAAAGLAETERFLHTRDDTDRSVRGLVGLHAMSTVGPETLGHAADLARRFGAGVHLHVGESPHDNEDSLARHGARPVARLAAAGALTPRSVIAHAIHVTDDELATLAAADVLVAHNPRSNASNGVGVADLGQLRHAGLTMGLGGDGFTQDIRAELDLLPLLQRQQWRDSTVMSPGETIALGVDGNAATVERLTGWRTGRVAPGHVADLVALDYDPVVPLADHNVLWHYARGFPGGTVTDVWVGGRTLLRHGVFQTLDAERLRAEARTHLPAVWAA